MPKPLAAPVTEITDLDALTALLEERLAKRQSEMITRIADLEAKLQQAESGKAEAQESNIAGAKQDDLSPAEQITSLNQRLYKANKKIHALQEKLMAEKKDHAKAIAHAQAEIKKQLSYRFGNLLVKHIRNPLAWPLLPFFFYREYKYFRSHHQALAPNAGKLEQFGYKRLFKLYEQRGLDALIQKIQKLQSKEPLREQAMGFLSMAKIFSEKKLPDEDLALAKHARTLDESESTLRGFFWAAQRSGDMHLACETLVAMEALITPDSDEASIKRMASLRKQVAYQLTLLNHVESPKERQIEVVPDRICYILHNALPFSSGGYATRSHGIAQGLKANGKEVFMLTRPGFPLDIVEDIDTETLSEQDTIDGISYIRSLYPQTKGMVLVDYILQSARVLEEKFRDLRPEYIVAASNYRVGMMALIAARRLGIPFYYDVRGWWELTRMSRDPEFTQTSSYLIQRLMESELCKQADHIFTLTEPMRDELISRAINADNISLLPNSCDPSQFIPQPRDETLAMELGIPSDIPVIGYIGTFVDYEGLDDLASACALLRQRGQEFRLLLVGNENTSGKNRGVITERIATIAKEQGFTDWLIMPGRIPHEQVSSYYSLIDIAPFPRKPWPVCEMVSPMKPLEALAMEKAVVVSSVRALDEMIRHDETGMVYPKTDNEALADTLQQLIRNPALRKQLGTQGRAWVEQERTWEHTTQQMITTLDALNA